jgi:hypothetical protein
VLVLGPIALLWFYQYKKYSIEIFSITVSVIEGPWDLPNIKQHDDDE